MMSRYSANWQPIAQAIKYGGAVIQARDFMGVEFLTEWCPTRGKWLRTFSPFEPVEFRHYS